MESEGEGKREIGEREGEKGAECRKGDGRERESGKSGKVQCWGEGEPFPSFR